MKLSLLVLELSIVADVTISATALTIYFVYDVATVARKKNSFS